MADFSGRDDSGRSVEFYDADEDGALAILGLLDPYDEREEMFRRIHELDRAASFRPATHEEVERRQKSLLGQKVDIVKDDERVSGIVVAIEIVENQTAIYRVMEGHQTGPTMTTTDVEVYDFFEVDQEPN